MYYNYYIVLQISKVVKVLFQSVLSIWDQLELFKEYKEKLKAIAGEGRAAHIISESLYIVCAGSNDVVLTYFSPTSPYRKMQYDFSSYASFLVQTASSFLEVSLFLILYFMR